MKRIVLIILFLSAAIISKAGKIFGTVTDSKGNPLAYASVFIKGRSKGVVAGSQGKYQLTVEPGNYLLVCQFVGFRSVEKTVTLGTTDEEINFVLQVQELSMKEVVIKRGEDPAIEIIRQTIKKRNEYNNQIDSFTVDVYVKGLIRSKAVPDKMLGTKVDRRDMEKQGFDSLGRGILFLSESQTKVSFKRPDKIKYEVISARQSGGGYGIGFPFFINFYTNHVTVFNNNLNPRGFISPIADNAFHYYKFHYEGNFFEGNKMIDRIKVTPKRKHEPLFEGYIQIIDDEWKIHSLDLKTTKNYQLDLIDTLNITQVHAPVNEKTWRTQNQVVYIAANTFGFGWSGNFLNVYNNYDLNPAFDKKYFNRIVMSYDTAFNKKDSVYWNSIRPVPLELEEKKDFVFRDSLYKAIRDSIRIRSGTDSLGRRNQPVKMHNMLLSGIRKYHYSDSVHTIYKIRGLIPSLEYNTVEGIVIDLLQSYSIEREGRKNNIEFSLNMRYGFSNQHFNAGGRILFSSRNDQYRNRFFSVAGGKRVSQFNHDNPIDAFTNSIYTLAYKKNYLKIYENWFGELVYHNRFENGMGFQISSTFEDRIPLQNTTDYSLGKKNRFFLPNHPYELAIYPFDRQKAFVAEIDLSFQPGQRYIQLPEGKVPLGSKYPVFQLNYSKGIKGPAGSIVDFDKWKLSVIGDANLKMGGLFKYRFSIGGFLNSKSVGLPDLQHFNGNRTHYNGKYLNSFQLTPYYQYSNKEKFYSLAHVEHHLNGLLTNKIPLFNRLKWNLVLGSNCFFVNRDQYYLEAFAGLENIFKILRVDFVTAYQTRPGPNFGIRIGLGGIIGGKVKVNR